MKRFIVVIITLLFLSVFLMMNYLLWDKDNLIKQQQSDRVQQDWLRGQNKTLEDTINELESNNATLERNKADLTEQLSGLQRQLQAATNRETNLRRTLDSRSQNLDALKTATLPMLQNLFVTWMGAVSEGRVDDSFRAFARDYQIMQRVLTLEEYRDYVERNLRSVSFRNPEEVLEEGEEPAEAPLFTRVGNESGDLTVLVRTQVYVKLMPESDTTGIVFREGLNTLQLQFVYDVINQRWYMQSIYPEN